MRYGWKKTLFEIGLQEDPILDRAGRRHYMSKGWKKTLSEIGLGDNLNEIWAGRGP